MLRSVAYRVLILIPIQSQREILAHTTQKAESQSLAYAAGCDEFNSVTSNLALRSAINERLQQDLSGQLIDPLFAFLLRQLGVLQQRFGVE